MRNWHPLSKIVIVLGIAGVAVTWLTDGDGPAEHSPAATRAAAAAQGTGDGSARDDGGDAGLPADTEAAAPLVARILPAEESLQAMVERPLFAPDRRPYDPGVDVAMVTPTAPVVTTVDAPTPPAVRFIGSIVEDGAVRALVGDGFNVQSVSIGEAIEGWAVLDIEPRRLTLGFDDARLELTILE